MSGYSLEDRQNENQNYKHFSGKTYLATIILY